MRLLLTQVTLAVVATCLTSGAPQQLNDQPRVRPKEAPSISEPIDIYENSVYKVKGGDLLAYDPIEVRPSKFQTFQVDGRNSDNSVNKGSSLLNTDRLGSSPKRAKLAASTAEEIPDSPNVERFSSIAHNSREVRLVGPNQREVEMKDDVASKVVVALENLQKEASDVWDQMNEKLDKGWKDIKRSEVWGQVNEKLDKSWTDLKTMVEGVVAPSSSKRATIQP